MSDDEKLIRLGQKAAIDDEGMAEGWLAPFDGPVKGGKDLDGENFGPTTDFALDFYPSIPILYAHGQNAEIGAAKVGEISVKEIRDKGLWVQGQLDKQGAYYDALHELAGKGDLYWSSGAIAHLVTKDERTGFIKQWPIAEATLTMTPANPWATATIKEPEPPVEPILEPIEAAKEGRRNSTSDQAIVQTMHDHAVALGADCAGPGKSTEIAPTFVLSVKGGGDVEPTVDLAYKALKDRLAEIAIAEARRLTTS